MFRNREIAKTIEFNFITVIKVIVLPKESYSPFISYNYCSIKNYTWKFQNTFRNGFLVNMFRFRPKNGGKF